jgi:hypothetical protein
MGKRSFGEGLAAWDEPRVVLVYTRTRTSGLPRYSPQAGPRTRMGDTCVHKQVSPDSVQANRERGGFGGNARPPPTS